MLRAVALSLRARLLVAAAAEVPDENCEAWLKEAAKICSQLEREKFVSYPKVFAATVRPALSCRKNQKMNAIKELRFAITISEENKMLFHVAGAKYRLGILLGEDTDEGRELIEEALAYCEEHKIKKPTAMFDIIIPGY